MSRLSRLVVLVGLVIAAQARAAGLAYVDFYDRAKDGFIGLGTAFSVAVTAGGQHVYEASRGGFVAVMARDDATGRLRFIQAEHNGVDGLDGAYGVTVSSDGKHLYATGAIENSVAVFARDAGTGKLTFVEVKKDGVDGVQGLKGPGGVVVSADGTYVYVTAAQSGTV